MANPDYILYKILIKRGREQNMKIVFIKCKRKKLPHKRMEKNPGRGEEEADISPFIPSTYFIKNIDIYKMNNTLFLIRVLSKKIFAHNWSIRAPRKKIFVHNSQIHWREIQFICDIPGTYNSITEWRNYDMLGFFLLIIFNFNLILPSEFLPGRCSIS